MLALLQDKEMKLQTFAFSQKKIEYNSMRALCGRKLVLGSELKQKDIEYFFIIT